MNDPRAEFDALVSEAREALAEVLDDGDVILFWTAHKALNQALGLLLTHRWDAA